MRSGSWTCFVRCLKMFVANPIFVLIIVTISISSTIAQTDSAELRENINEELEKVLNQLDNFEWRGPVSPGEPGCLRPVLRSGVSKMRLYLGHYKRWRFVDEAPSTPLRESEEVPSDQIEYSVDFNAILTRLRDINESLRVASNTVSYIKNELKSEIYKQKLQKNYDIESELNMECDSLNGIFSSTVQLARRLLPPTWKRIMMPPRSPMIRIKTMHKN